MTLRFSPPLQGNLPAKPDVILSCLTVDLACKKKELALAQKEYSDVLAALESYKKAI